ncbi:hypothetical protein [Nocardioides cynanchi]|uniref:hypothetical protein n=1 Tax=Nocardioides cynanchi TaxID=2558918 RepID=UPI0012458D17|nr:hypothetical protein [Nocardioides cynanchi]
MPEPGNLSPAFYARRGGAVSDWWTLLHPPYTLWHLSYVVLGAAMAPHLDRTALVWSVVAFFLAVGVAAHAFDELQGRPLGTRIPDLTLRVVGTVALVAACGLGIAGVFRHGSVDWLLLASVPIGVVLLVGYNLELFDGRLHSDAVFAWGWGGFPVVVGFLAQRPDPAWSSVTAAGLATLAGVGTSYVQRSLSTPARALRRRTSQVTGAIRRHDGSVLDLDLATLLRPLENALRALSWVVPAVAAAALVARL